MQSLKELTALAPAWWSLPVILPQKDTTHTSPCNSLLASRLPASRILLCVHLWVSACLHSWREIPVCPLTWLVPVWVTHKTLLQYSVATTTSSTIRSESQPWRSPRPPILPCEFSSLGYYPRPQPSIFFRVVIFLFYNNSTVIVKNSSYSAFPLQITVWFTSPVWTLTNK